MTLTMLQVLDCPNGQYKNRICGGEKVKHHLPKLYLFVGWKLADI